MRLVSELTRLRVKKGCVSNQQLWEHLEVQATTSKFQGATDNAAAAGSNTTTSTPNILPHPRWIRINTLKTTLAEQLQTTFSNYKAVDTLEPIITASKSIEESRLFHIDKNISNLIAIPRAIDLSVNTAYRNGSLILQDKASCFPAFLLDPDLDGPCIDACAAPGNKTTHIAAILFEKSQRSSAALSSIFACELSRDRSKTLVDMIQKSSTKQVRIFGNMDFLTADPQQRPWREATSLLLDPSCSGSGIVGRDEGFSVALPSIQKQSQTPTRAKRKDKHRDKAPQITPSREQQHAPTEIRHEVQQHPKSRLDALSAFQLKLLLHAFSFPNARKVTYSTCSIHTEENEIVVVRALDQSRKENLGWRVLTRGEQIEGLRSWHLRGNIDAVRHVPNNLQERTVADACIRCEKGTTDGTQGFFVAAFTRNIDGKIKTTEDEEWVGFSDDEH